MALLPHADISIESNCLPRRPQTAGRRTTSIHKHHPCVSPLRITVYPPFCLVPVPACFSPPLRILGFASRALLISGPGTLLASWTALVILLAPVPFNG